MKNLHCLIICLIFLSYSFKLASQPFQGEEAQVYQAIEDDIRYFDQRDYNKWAAMWVHEPYVQNVWMGPNEYGGNFGWEELNNAAKQIMDNYPDPAPTNFQGRDFKFLIKENLAIVEYTYEGIRYTRVLEKKAGAWKMAQIQRLQLEAYQSKIFKDELKKMEGNWVLIPGSVVVKNSKWGLESAICSSELTPSGIRLSFRYQVKNPNGNLQQAEEVITTALNSADQQMLATRIWHWPGPGQTYVSTGTGKAIGADGLIINTTAIGAGKQKVEHHLKIDSNGHLILGSMFFPQEEQEWSMSFSMTRE